MKMGQSIIALSFVSVVSAARAEGIVSVAGHSINTDSAPVCILSRSSDNKPYPSKRYICEQILGVGDLRVKTLHADWCE
ncbi:MAG: hypothetical protein JKY66_08210, partial [Spongiibacteraceae bacterium]|nr:hypothetical protein [Spongiibacteraceae bacterium]